MYRSIEDGLEEYEERAGIMEFLGNLTREEAEKSALRIILNKRRFSRN